MTIELSPHAKKRLKIRQIAEVDVISALKNPDKILFNGDTGNFIAVKKINDKMLVVVYMIVGNIVRVVSAFITSKLDIVDKRIRKGRWRII